MGKRKPWGGEPTGPLLVLTAEEVVDDGVGSAISVHQPVWEGEAGIHSLSVTGLVEHPKYPRTGKGIQMWPREAVGLSWATSFRDLTVALDKHKDSEVCVQRDLWLQSPSPAFCPQGCPITFFPTTILVSPLFQAGKPKLREVKCHDQEQNMSKHTGSGAGPVLTALLATHHPWLLQAWACSSSGSCSNVIFSQRAFPKPRKTFYEF